MTDDFLHIKLLTGDEFFNAKIEQNIDIENGRTISGIIIGLNNSDKIYIGKGAIAFSETMGTYKLRKIMEVEKLIKKFSCTEINESMRKFIDNFWDDDIIVNMGAGGYPYLRTKFGCVWEHE